MSDSNNLVRLREIQRADLPKLYEFQLEPEGNQLAKTRARSRVEFDKHWDTILSDETVVLRAIVWKGTLAGCISCFRIQDETHVGYWIGKASWGAGVATGALHTMLTEVSIRPLFARVAASNAGSIRVLKKCGFQEVCREWSPATERFIECEEVVFRLP